MNPSIIQLLVLIGVAVFLILKLRSVLGTREGFEKPRVDLPKPAERTTHRDFEVIEGGADADITDHVPDGSDAAKALAAMKLTEPGFNVDQFLTGARGAYEMILMAFENGDIGSVQGFLSEDVYESFLYAIADREDKGLKIDATFVGLREIELVNATFARDTNEAELTVKFVGELTSVVRNTAGEVVEGDANQIKRQRDVWTFAREMGANDPNWQLVATGE
ncbi:Tim44/TimA family putative adaptor protein [Actibacterium sp. XHP0104]|uniref:Tim44/TimA family putative adaptor protein n=1 Tax=Actibacterium sp. XHP0104 TaxID=2984335 RepID=UPI0021E896F8|nr:Tim44/TimA family putative adaptor protein [Actibacterium sp. XHP0104]MCV2882111.1 Tim44/TimA family putative adaptor protein [Actibacterium sp. XHP0104]